MGLRTIAETIYSLIAIRGIKMYLNMEKDELFMEAARLIVGQQQGSASLLQRKLGIGHHQAALLMEQLSASGVVGEFTAVKPRVVLVPDLGSLERLLAKVILVNPMADKNG